MPGQPIPCPRCGTLSEHLVTLEPGMRLSLQEAGEKNLPDQVCPACFEQLTGTVSQGLKLRMERDVREKNKMMMWKNRVHLIKTARGLMGQRAYSEAAVQYEKYLRVLELVYSLNKGELSPTVFNNSTRSKELTIIASVYWDLIRIYDTSPRYGDRMSHSAGKLAEFLPFSSIYPDIIKKAEQFSRSAKHPEVLRSFLRSTKSRRGPCFIATAAFDSHAVELHILREFRDQVLRPRRAGRALIVFYYRVSPPLAHWLARHPRGNTFVRRRLTKLAFFLKKNLLTRPSLRNLDA